MITVRDLTRAFGPFRAVDRVSFELERGEVVGFLGPNGAGKTTTMRMLTGFLPPTSGEVRIAGHDVFHDSLAVRRKLGYLSEAVPLYGEHRVLEMLAFQARLHGLPRASIDARSREVLERVGLADRARSLIGNLSKGQRQRIGIAVAMLPDPEVLILDEPTSGLDPLQRIEIRRVIQELAEDRTVLLSSHILPEVEAVCPRVIIMHRGRIVADGEQAELVRQHEGAAPVRVEAVVGDPAEARRLLESLPGVTAVEDLGRRGIHHGFDVHAAGDVREDVGALALQRGWALRELSWEEPSLEKLFASIALELEVPESGDAPAPPAEPAPPPAPAAAPPGAAPGGPPGDKVLFNLNPFDGGADRDLGRPKANGASTGDGLVTLDPPPGAPPGAPPGTTEDDGGIEPRRCPPEERA